jgi:hypothetical protein
MKHVTLLLAAVALCGPASALAAAGARPTQASMRYHRMRQAETAPPYSLPKVRAMVRRLKADSEGSSRLSAKAWDALSFQEKFTYVMIHGEDFSQNCADAPSILQEERKIFAFTPSPFNDEAEWSKRQLAFLKDNRARVIGLMRETMRSQGRAGSNLKHAVTEINAVELIPDLVGLYNRSRADHDLLTVLMVLMKEGKYPPFLATATCRHLFGEHANFEAFIPATPANQRQITDLAMAYYRSYKK